MTQVVLTPVAGSGLASATTNTVGGDGYSPTPDVEMRPDLEFEPQSPPGCH